MEAKLRHSFIDIMRKFDLRNHLTPELKSQFAKSEEKNHFDKRSKDLEKDEARCSLSALTTAYIIMYSCTLQNIQHTLTAYNNISIQYI